MKNLAQSLCLMLCLMAAFSCSPDQREEDYNLTVGQWGHLKDIANTNPSKLYLSHVKRDETYRICMAQDMSNKYPGIENELTAAIKIWAYYIERDLIIEIVKRNLPPADPLESEETLMNLYFNECPTDTHLVVGEAYFSDSAVGKTLLASNGRKRDVIKFQRALFLRISEENDDQEVVWKTLSQALGKEVSTEEILEIMKRRDTTIYLTGRKELLTLQTLTHEIGHVWGLCDQYYFIENITNCDLAFASLDGDGHIMLDKEATMATTSWIAKTFLSDDDIEGIRKLAERPLFMHDWPTTFRSLEVPEVSPGPVIPVAEIKSARAVKNGVEVDFSLVTKIAPVTMMILFHDSITDSWITYQFPTSEVPLHFRSYVLNFDLGRYFKADEVRIIVQVQGSATVEMKADIEGIRVF